MPAFSLAYTPPYVHTTASPQYTTLPYPTPQRHCHDFGGVLEPRYIIGAESLDQ